ncbi:MAG: hypothetical protein DMG45_13465 [Acidobacteria bacterium]|nr:MAG: hypothetical protein DMG45_13465 [Acidobacteriota bacterium]
MTTLRIQFFRVVAIVFSVSVSFVPVAVAIPQNAPASASRAGEERKLEGTWRGDSLCVEKGTACHDEVAVYRIAAIPGKRGLLMVTGGKIADGKEIVMGSGEWRYDSGKRFLWSFPAESSPLNLTVTSSKELSSFPIRPFFAASR